MVKMYKGDREVNAAPGQINRLELAGWSKTPPSDAAAEAPVDPAPAVAANDADTAASEPDAAGDASGQLEETATNGGDEGEAADAPADDAPADDADPDQDELPLAAETGDAPVA